MWHNKSGRANCDYSYHMAVTWWGEKVFDGIADSIKAGMTSFKHFMAYKGALMVNDDEMFASFQRCAELGKPLVLTKVGRMAAGNFGDCKPIAEGVWELRIDWGPGYRVYYSQRGTRLLLLLAGGDKSSQSKDIRLAIRLARQIKE